MVGVEAPWKISVVKEIFGDSSEKNAEMWRGWIDTWFYSNLYFLKKKIIKKIPYNLP